ncbi:putative methyltransferase [Chondrocystis sp. NIES-4102]|nr:putative methyltransferase [Chondrocystis sp. NIES-4102]
MVESEYIFTDTQFTSELARLKILEKISDPTSHKRISATGIDVGWQCLEIGAGAGSITYWLSSLVGSQGKITAIDIDTRFLTDTSFTNVEIIQGDINQLSLPNNCFDLIHARNILIHLVTHEAIISKMLSWLKPGGWLVLEEPDFSALKSITGTLKEHQAFEKIKKAIAQMFTNRGLDYDLGIRLPSLIQKLGLQQIQVENNVPISPGGSDVAIMMKLSAMQLAAKYIATGKTTTEDLQTYIQFAENPTTWAIYLATVGVSGQKPQT